LSAFLHLSLVDVTEERWTVPAIVWQGRRGGCTGVRAGTREPTAEGRVDCVPSGSVSA